ncbi:MAG TPA: glycosyltransferase family 39 protein [Phycisphaerales bacterium]|nr:glycosyltransferase family 39 protein [Phycisphaerales bacterium]
MLDRLATRPILQLLMVIAVGAAAYLPFLGTRPLDFSEGHRAVPGWTMLESHDYWHIRMFGLTYFRKPPGMPWAIALSSAVFGESTFGARFPSALCAICMGGLAWWYGRRWFGKTGGLVAGLSQALMPLMWSPGRTAEIEMLNNLGTQMLALGLIDVLVFQTPRKNVRLREEGPFGFVLEMCGASACVLVPVAGIMIAGLAKGPASAPVLGGVLVGACVAARSIRTLARPRLGITLILAGGLLALLGMKIYLANSDPDAVREDVAGQFLWNGKRVLGVATLIPAALASALPMSLGLFTKRLSRGPVEGAADRVARTLAYSWLAAVGILVVCGVSNARYAMPAAVLLPLLVPFAASAARPWIEAARSRRRVFGSPVRWGLLMALGALWYVVLTSVSPTQDQLAGVRAAQVFLGQSWDGRLWANDAIEARPDVLWLLDHCDTHRGSVRWKKAELRAGELPDAGDSLLLRTDAGSVEAKTYRPFIESGALRKRAVARIRDYELTMYTRSAPR